MMSFIARRITRFSWIVALLVFTVMSVGGTLAGVAPSASASPGYKMAPSGPDFRDYCLQHGYPNGATDPVNGNAYDYACIAADGSLHGFNGSPPLGTVGDVCRWSNPGIANVVERLSEKNFYSPWGAWSCLQLQSSSEKGLGLDLARYCTAYMRLDGVQLHGKTANSWYCYWGTKSNPRYFSLPIDMYQACRWQYGFAYIDNTPNFYDPNSPKCWD
jgi:hypothetical protein